MSPALFEPIGAKFRADMKDWALASGIPVIRFRAGERKADVMAPYLDAAAAAGRSQVVAIGCAQEFQLVWTARKRDTDPGGCPQFSFTKEKRQVSVFYVYIWDNKMGSGFIKICTYFPYPVKAWVFPELGKPSCKFGISHQVTGAAPVFKVRHGWRQRSAARRSWADG